jgi:hypothetical protein
MNQVSPVLQPRLVGLRSGTCHCFGMELLPSAWNGLGAVTAVI